MSENRSNQVSIVFLNEKASKKSSFSNTYFSNTSTSFWIFSSRTVRIGPNLSTYLENLLKIDQHLVKNLDPNSKKFQFSQIFRKKKEKKFTHFPMNFCTWTLVLNEFLPSDPKNSKNSLIRPRTVQNKMPNCSMFASISFFENTQKINKTGHCLAMP